MPGTTCAIAFSDVYGILSACVRELCRKDIDMKKENQTDEEARNQAAELADRIIAVLDEKKARSISLLHVEEQTILADYFVVCEGTSNTQIKALASELEFKLSEEGKPPLRIEGYNEGTWIVVDFGSVIVHIFNHDLRSFYNLEKLWNQGTEIFKTKSSEPLSEGTEEESGNDNK